MLELHVLFGIREKKKQRVHSTKDEKEIVEFFIRLPLKESSSVHSRLIMSAKSETDDVVVPQLDNLLKVDPYLTPFAGEIKRRYVRV